MENKLGIKVKRGPKIKGPEVEIKQLWSVYTKRAKDRNRIWNLTNEQFLKLINDCCYYCGVEPQQKRVDKRNNRIPFLYNGIDRKDNLKGYSIENVVTCCGFCNRAKSHYSVDDLLNWIKQVQK